MKLNFSGHAQQVRALNNNNQNNNEDQNDQKAIDQFTSPKNLGVMLKTISQGSTLSQLTESKDGGAMANFAQSFLQAMLLKGSTKASKALTNALNDTKLDKHAITQRIKLGTKILCDTSIEKFDGKSPVNFKYDMSIPHGASGGLVKVKILDKDKKLRKIMDSQAYHVGANIISWDGIDNSGNKVEEGEYEAVIMTENHDHKVNQTIAGTVLSIGQDENGELYYKLSDGQSISIDSVRSIGKDADQVIRENETREAEEKATNAKKQEKIKEKELKAKNDELELQRSKEKAVIAERELQDDLKRERENKIEAAKVDRLVSNTLLDEEVEFKCFTACNSTDDVLITKKFSAQESQEIKKTWGEFDVKNYKDKIAPKFILHKIGSADYIDPMEKHSFNGDVCTIQFEKGKLEKNASYSLLMICKEGNYQPTNVCGKISGSRSEDGSVICHGNIIVKSSEITPTLNELIDGVHSKRKTVTSDDSGILKSADDVLNEIKNKRRSSINF
ncbi:MAG: FlgD immunoglobulin-like domain containing protein [Rickettsiaceae bacterium]